jgi:hypothetical protein
MLTFVIGRGSLGSAHAAAMAPPGDHILVGDLAARKIEVRTFSSRPQISLRLWDGNLTMNRQLHRHRQRSTGSSGLGIALLHLADLWRTAQERIAVAMNCNDPVDSTGVASGADATRHL